MFLGLRIAGCVVDLTADLAISDGSCDAPHQEVHMSSVHLSYKRIEKARRDILTCPFNKQLRISIINKL